MIRKVINIIFCLGLLMLIYAVSIPIIHWVLLLSGVFTEIHGYSILGIRILILLYWGGFLLILPKLIWGIKDITIFGKIIIITGILFIGYMFYSGEWKIGCQMKKPDYISFYNYDHQRSTTGCRPMD